MATLSGAIRAHPAGTLSGFDVGWCGREKEALLPVTSPFVSERVTGIELAFSAWEAFENGPPTDPHVLRDARDYVSSGSYWRTRVWSTTQQQVGVRGSCDPLLDDGGDIVARRHEHLDRASAQVLVELDLHRTSTKRPLASSAP